MQKISKDQTTKTSYKKDANFLYGLDSNTSLFGSKTFDNTWITIGLIGVLLLYTIIMVIWKGIGNIFSDITQMFQDTKIILITIALVIIAVIYSFSIRKSRKMFKEMNQKANSELYKDMNYGMTNDYAIKFYSEGMQINENFFKWEEIKKIISKGIIRVRYLKDTKVFSGYTRDAFECYYFIGLQDLSGKIYTAKLHEQQFRQSNNPTKTLKKILKKMSKISVLEEKGIEWIKGNIDEANVKNKLENPFVS